MPLKKAGDLIPVVSEFKSISSGARRRAQFMNFIHRGLVTYSTLVYDRNIGDVMALVNYFHPEFFTEQELNDRFGLFPNSDGKHDLLKKDGDDSMVPRILIFPEDTHNVSQTPIQRPQSRESEGSPDWRSSPISWDSPSALAMPDTSLPPPSLVKPFILPSRRNNYALTNDQGDSSDEDVWPPLQSRPRRPRRARKAQEVSAPLERRWGGRGDQGEDKED